MSMTYPAKPYTQQLGMAFVLVFTMLFIVLGQTIGQVQAAGLTIRNVAPATTDPNINNWLNDHMVYLDQSVASNHQLFLYLGGGNSKPSNTTYILKQAAADGYYAINLMYPNTQEPNPLCGNDPTTDCFGKLRMDILDGGGRFLNGSNGTVEVTPANSIYNRLTRLLDYLNNTYPTEGWGQFLANNTPDWSKISLAGHSQGGNNIAVIAKENVVARVAMFAAPDDYYHRNQPDARIANWITTGHVTPTERYFGFISDKQGNSSNVYNVWSALGMQGAVVNVDTTSPPYNNSQRLMTTHESAQAGEYHGSVVVDRNTPLNADGTPVFAPVWQYVAFDPIHASVNPFADPAFYAVWLRTDKPVADNAVSRSWLWGPQPFATVVEEYAEGVSGTRLVQYFDKSRMELTNPAGDKTSPYYVTNGLLAAEMMKGQLQIGNNTFVDRAPAEIGVAGDPDDMGGATYATLGKVMGATSVLVGTPITTTLDRAGNTAQNPALAAKNVTAAYSVADTNHTIAKPFWDFLNSQGLVYDNNGQSQTAAIFSPTFYATGFPLTEAYWTTVKVGGIYKDVLVQAFERRILTYTPGNPAGFQVEMGNVGRHYYSWRYNIK